MSIKSLMFRRGLSSHVLGNHRYMKSTLVESRIRQEYESPLFLGIYPGIRAIELKRPDEGNHLSPEVLMMLQRYVESFESNEIVHTIIFTSSSPDLFSKGFNEMGKETIESAHNLVKTIKNYKKPLIASYGGHLSGSSYALFANSQYRLGTEATRFCISECLENKIPICGLAYHMVQGSSDGEAIARYLAVTGKTIGAEAMMELGLLTHLVEEDAQTSIGFGLGHTTPEKETKAYQDVPVHEKALGTLLDSMCIYDTKFEEDDVDKFDQDIMNDETWDEFLLARPDPVNLNATSDIEGGCDVTIEKMVNEISHCFSGVSVEDTIERLKDMEKQPGKSVWASETLYSISQVNRKCLEAWFRMTRMAKDDDVDLQEHLRKESEEVEQCQ